MRFCIDFFLNSDRPACFSVYYLYYVEAYFPYAFGFNVDCIAFIKVASMVLKLLGELNLKEQQIINHFKTANLTPLY